MRILRTFGNAALTVVALLGVLSALVWGATTVGFIQPLIVISGSMEPEIMTGDLLVARPLAVEEIEVGQVLSLTSEVTGDIVTHRVIAVTQVPGGAEVNMRGDANESADGETYGVSGQVWAPAWQWSGGGYVVRGITRPQFAVPAMAAIVALIGLTMLSPSRPAPTLEPKPDSDPDPSPDADPAADPQTPPTVPDPPTSGNTPTS